MINLYLKLKEKFNLGYELQSVTILTVHSSNIYQLYVKLLEA